MNKIQFDKLVKEYGKPIANRALRWFLENHSENFRSSVYQYRYIVSNEYLWRN